MLECPVDVLVKVGGMGRRWDKGPQYSQHSQNYCPIVLFQMSRQIFPDVSVKQGGQIEGIAWENTSMNNLIAAVGSLIGLGLLSP